NRDALRNYVNHQSTLLTPPVQLGQHYADEMLAAFRNDPDAAETAQALAGPVAQMQAQHPGLSPEAHTALAALHGLNAAKLQVPTEPALADAAVAKKGRRALKHSLPDGLGSPLLTAPKATPMSEPHLAECLAAAAPDSGVSLLKPGVA